MRAFEFKINENTVESSILAKASQNPQALSLAIKGIDAINDAARKAVELIKNKTSKKLSVKPTLQPPTIQPQSAPKTPAVPPEAVKKFNEAEEIDSIEELKTKLNDNAGLLKYLKFQASKGDKEAKSLVTQLTAKASELNRLLDNALKQAQQSYKSLDKYIVKLLSKVNDVNEQNIARARSIFLNDEIPIEDAKRFLEVAQTGVINMTAMVKKSKGRLDQFVVNDSVVKRVYVKVVNDFINWIPGKTAGNVGPAEYGLVMLGNPAGKEKKGDLKIGDEMFEVKASNLIQTQKKSGGLSTPERTGAIFDTGVSSKSIWPAVATVLKSYGFENLTEKRTSKKTNKEKEYIRFSLTAANFENYNAEFDRLGMNLSKRAELLTKIAETVFPSANFNGKEVKAQIQQILATTKGKLTPAMIPPGESESLKNNNTLLKYLNTLALQTYREEGESKNNFLFVNKSTREYRVYRGSQLDTELSNPNSDLKLINGIAFSLQDKQSKATPKIALG